MMEREYARIQMIKEEIFTMHEDNDMNEDKNGDIEVKKEYLCKILHELDGIYKIMEKSYEMKNNELQDRKNVNENIRAEINKTKKQVLEEKARVHEYLQS